MALSLTLPDICGKAEYPDVGSKKRYIDWYDEKLGINEKPSSLYDEDMPYISGEIVYQLRCALLHEGSSNIKVGKVREERCKVDRFILSISNAADSGISMVSYGQNLQIKKRELRVNIVNLCRNLIVAAQDYFGENEDKFDFLQYEIRDMRHE